MATIANLVANLDLKIDNYVAGVQKAVGTTAALAAGSVHLGAVNDAAEKAGGAFHQATAAANGYLKTLIGIGSAGALVAGGIRAVQQRDRAEAIGKGGGGAVGNGPSTSLAESYDRAARSISNLTEGFGRAFVASSGLTRVLDQIAAIAAALTPAFEMAGAVIGTFVGWITLCTPITVAFIVAIKALGVALGVLLAVLHAIIVRQLWIWITGASAASWLWAAATWAVSAAYAVLSGWVVFLEAVGFPLFVALGAVALVFAAALAVLAGIVYGLSKAWDWLTSGKVAKGAAMTAQQIEEMNKKIASAKDAANQMEADLTEKLRTSGWSAQAKDLDAYERKLRDARFPSDYVDAMLKIRAEEQARLKTMERQRDVLEAQLDAAKAISRIGNSAQQNRFADLRQQGYSPLQAGAMVAAEKVKEIAEAAGKRRLDIEKSIAEVYSKTAELKKKADQADMTSSQKQLADFKEMGVGAARLLGIKVQLDQQNADQKRIDAQTKIAELAKEAADLQFDADTAGLTAAQKRVALLEKENASADVLAAARANAATIDDAQQRIKDAAEAKRLIEASATPLEKYRKSIDDVQRLIKVGALTNPAAIETALNAAHKEFRDDIKTQDSFKLESPKALLRGTADAELAANRQKSPIENLTEIQKQQLAEQKRLKKVADDQLAAIKANKPPALAAIR